MKKFSIVMAIVLVGAMFLSACQPETIVETVIVEKEGETITEVVTEEVMVPSKTLVFSSRLFSPPAEQLFFINEIIKPFEEEHGVTVNFQIIDDAYPAATR